MDRFTTTYDVTMTSAVDDVIIPKTRQVSFIIPLTIECIIVACCIWLAVTLVIHGVRTNRFRRQSGNDLNGGIVYSLAVVSTLTVAVRCCCSIIAITLPPYKPGFDDECERTSDAVISLYLTALVPVYLLLWFRQRAIYAHPLMSSSHSKFIILLSWSSILFLLCAGTAVVLVFTIPKNRKSNYSGCELKTRESVNTAGSILTIIGQLMLLVLFIIPLRRNLQGWGSFSVMRKAFWRKSDSTTVSSPQVVNVNDDNSIGKPGLIGTNCTNVSTHTEASSSTNVPINKKILRIIQRSIVLATICILTDVTAMVISTYAMPKDGTRNNVYVLYDTSLLSNVICIILSFENYKTMIFPTIEVTKDSSSGRTGSLATVS
uniref:Ci-YFV-3 receptor n=1 Tax=Ciona intestinalis TaxID=7719 RepID=A0A3Q0PQF8_CIOIN|nr:uncharacterized protein LOC101242709 [Ciona intestinalis]BBC53707.1 Ci-YFV-3 receptor [Ciona intestinalis]|eukprot:XP_004226653.2 uncharacterized protein LOC101242709 [Ciona intestinalis]